MSHIAFDHNTERKKSMLEIAYRLSGVAIIVLGIASLFYVIRSVPEGIQKIKAKQKQGYLATIIGGVSMLVSYMLHLALWGTSVFIGAMLVGNPRLFSNPPNPSTFPFPHNLIAVPLSIICFVLHLFLSNSNRTIKAVNLLAYYFVGVWFADILMKIDPELACMSPWLLPGVTVAVFLSIGDRIKKATR